MKKADFIGILKKDKKALVIILIGVVGMSLLLLSDTGGKSKASSTEALPYGEKAEASLEKRLEMLLSRVNGVGNVRVMVTLEGTWENVYAKNESSDNGNDRNEYVIIKEGSKESGLKLGSYRPKIKGVGVSCDGAESDTVRERVTSLICATLGITSNRVYVAPS